MVCEDVRVMEVTVVVRGGWRCWKARPTSPQGGPTVEISA